MHVFNDLEGLRIAAEIEKRGEAFYRNGARISQDREAIALLESLAQDERQHFSEFQRLYDEAVKGRDVITPYDDETNAYLSAIAADIVFPGGLMSMRTKGFDDIHAVLDAAMQSEKDSILFYTELAEIGTNDSARATFLEIARQERTHLKRLLRMKEGL